MIRNPDRDLPREEQEELWKLLEDSDGLTSSNQPSASALAELSAELLSILHVPAIRVVPTTRGEGN
jgi:hypothetical protein